MPRNTREYLVRYYGQAYDNIDRTLEDIKKMTDIYGEKYPDHTAMLELIAAGLVELQSLLKTFRETML